MTMELVTADHASAESRVYVTSNGQLRYGPAVADRHELPQNGYVNVYADSDRGAIGITVADGSVDTAYSVNDRHIGVRRAIRHAGRSLPSSTTAMAYSMESRMLVVDLSNLPEQQTVKTEYQDTL